MYITSASYYFEVALPQKEYRKTAKGLRDKCNQIMKEFEGSSFHAAEVLYVPQNIYAEPYKINDFDYSASNEVGASETHYVYRLFPQGDMILKSQAELGFFRERYELPKGFMLNVVICGYRGKKIN